MAIVDSSSNEIVREFSLEELEQAARLMRGYDLVALCAAGSGHSGGTLSIMEIAAALYLKVARHDPENPDWNGRDRIIWSAWHKRQRCISAWRVPVITGAIGVKDRFGDSGAPWELIKEFGLSAEHIAQKAVELLAIAEMKKERRAAPVDALKRLSRFHQRHRVHERRTFAWAQLLSGLNRMRLVFRQ